MKFSAYIVLVLLALVCIAHAGSCDISQSAETRLLSLSYIDFDQTMGDGWRTYADQGCYNEAAHLLDKYLSVNKASLVDWQIRVITWHAGQMFAFNNNYPSAKFHFVDSLDPSESKDTPILWNEYVHASIAFLDKDMVKLKLHREVIANGPDFNGEKVNLHVVDSLIKCFNEPYSIAYSGCQK